MKVIELSQQDDREAWLELRRGIITGTKAKGIKPLSRGSDRTPEGFWALLAEKIAIKGNGEDDMARGARLENEALKKTAEKFKLDLNYDPGIWISDENDEIAVSPDAVENKKVPTYAAECKAFASKNHLKIVILDKRARKEKSYRPFDNIPKDHQDQVIQHFIVNDDLKTLYWTLYDDLVAIDEYVHHVIVIERSDVEEEVRNLKAIQIDTLEEINKLIAEIIKENK